MVSKSYIPLMLYFSGMFTEKKTTILFILHDSLRYCYSHRNGKNPVILFCNRFRLFCFQVTTSLCNLAEAWWLCSMLEILFDLYFLFFHCQMHAVSKHRIRLKLRSSDSVFTHTVVVPFLCPYSYPFPFPSLPFSFAVSAMSNLARSKIEPSKCSEEKGIRNSYE